ncbi:MAG: sulfatase-like hydrolase/transferase [Planctomycetota bacterium]|jgi:arylsulfatase A-like enzyme|nr:sulfatase-like hydrolase/transferase [Planctomycetota bacterium]
MPAHSTDERPNILLIMTDQQRGDCLSIEDHPCLLTPNMDHIAGAGTRFSRCYSTCPSCIPARRALLTGQFPATNGMVGFQDGHEFDSTYTLPQVLSDSGYQTYLVGRPMHQFPSKKRYGYDQMVRGPVGFDEKYEGSGGAFGHGISGNGWTARPWHLDEGLHPTNQSVSEALRFLECYHDPTAPFFLTVSFIAPHPPLVPPAFYLDRYLRADMPEPVIGDWAEPPPNDGIGLQVQSDQVHLKGEALRSCQAGYYGLINHLDDQLYRLLGSHSGMSGNINRNTVIIFTTDHGEMLGDHCLFRKCYPYEGSARIPLLIRGTAEMGFPGNNVIDSPVGLEDIMPTILDLAGAEIPDCVDGESLVPFLRGEDQEWRPFIHGEHSPCYRQEQANHYLTDGKEKFVWLTHEGHEQLFDLVNDPDECRNLAAEPDSEGRVSIWRNRLMERLKNRPEGFTDGKQLVAGRPYSAALPHAL